MAQGSNSNEGEVIFKLDVETDKTHKDTLDVLLALWYFYYFLYHYKD